MYTYLYSGTIFKHIKQKLKSLCFVKTNSHFGSCTNEGTVILGTICAASETSWNLEKREAAKASEHDREMPQP